MSLDAIAVPDRLQEPVGEAEAEDIQHGFLADVVIDAEDLRFVERVVEDPVQLLGGGKVATEGLLDDDPGVLRAAGLSRFFTTIPNTLGGIAR